METRQWYLSKVGVAQPTCRYTAVGGLQVTACIRASDGLDRLPAVPLVRVVPQRSSERKPLEAGQKRKSSRRGAVIGAARSLGPVGLAPLHRTVWCRNRNRWWSGVWEVERAEGVRTHVPTYLRLALGWVTLASAYASLPSQAHQTLARLRRGLPNQAKSGQAQPRESL